MSVDPENQLILHRKKRRTKTGCITCRIRRIKCDEEKPHCRKCVSTGRKCDGYSKPPPPTKPAPVALLVSVSDGPPPTECDATARSAFQFFYEVCAPALVNYGSHNFWNKLVLQACHADQSIKHLVIAASALDREARSTERLSRPSNNPVFLFHYGAALDRIGSNQSPSIGIVLIACLLLIICDEFQDNRFGALQHFLAGRRILSSYHVEKNNTMNHDMTVDELGSIFQQLQLQTGELDQETMPRQIRWKFSNEKPSSHFRSDPDCSQSVCSKSLARSYKTLAMAASHLQRLVPFCMARRPSTRPPYSSFHIVPNVTPQLNQWLTNFNALCKRMDSVEASKCFADIHLLRMYHLCLTIMSRCAPFNVEKLYNWYGADFEHLCVKFAYFLDKYPAQETIQKLLCPLFFVAAHCRDIAFRTQAIDSLRRCGWSGIRLATIAEKVVEIEEGDGMNFVVCNDVPEESRIRVRDINFARNEVSGQTSGILHFECSPRANLPGEFRQHRFDWPDVQDAAVQQSIKQLLQRVLRFEFT